MYVLIVVKDEQNQRISVERQLYEKTKKELNQKIRDEREIHQKELHEAQLRYVDDTYANILPKLSFILSR